MPMVMTVTVLPEIIFLDVPGTGTWRDCSKDRALILQTFDFDDDSDIEIVLGSETITLHYDAGS